MCSVFLSTPPACDEKKNPRDAFDAKNPTAPGDDSLKTIVRARWATSMAPEREISPVEVGRKNHMIYDMVS